jgi:stress response protein SCP2
VEINNHAGAQDHVYADAKSDLKEIVMGLHWDPPEEGAKIVPEDLDAVCMLLDEQDRVLEVVHPDHLRNANGSVIHTGDSRTGANEWDNERIFVFLEALPKAVFKLTFVVASAKGSAFGGIRGASCHISDRITEREWLRCDLAALGRHTAHCVATVRRNATSWDMWPDRQSIHVSSTFAPKAHVSESISAKLGWQSTVTIEESLS